MPGVVVEIGIGEFKISADTSGPLPVLEFYACNHGEPVGTVLPDDEPEGEPVASIVLYNMAALETLQRAVDHVAPLFGPVEPIQAILAGVTEQVEEASHDDSARWLTCSGCYEGVDGHNTHGFPHSEAFGCVLGGGCQECGGIGAVWDTTDYAAMADDMLGRSKPAAAPVDAESPPA